VPLPRRALTRSVIGGCSAAASSSACHWCGQSWRTRSIHQAGWFQAPTGSRAAAAATASRSRTKRRSTALTKPAAAGVRWRVQATAWSTSVWSG
jgi:hypothetical protein